MLTKVTYVFSAFPVTYYPGQRYRNKPLTIGYRGWVYGMLSTFTYDSLRDAKREVARLRRVYKLTKRTRLLRDPELLKLWRVETTAV